MKLVNLLRFFLVVLVMVGLALSCNKDTELSSLPVEEGKLITFQHRGVIPGQYIVVLKSDAVSDRAAKDSDYKENMARMRKEAENILGSLGISTDKIDHAYGTALQGFSVKNVTVDEAKALSAHTRVDYVEQDQTVSVQGGPPGGGGGITYPHIPWGITRVNGGVDATGSKAWIIDSGIDLDHPDLNVGQGVYFTGNSPDDGNGHGTHVAGTVGARGDNSIGVIGVAAGATVVPVRVLGNNGSGSYSDVIAGVNHVAGYAANGDVANMSLGGPVSAALDQAVLTASGTCKFTLAAGNEATNAGNSSPARVNGPNVYTIASMTSNDGWSSFSNYGKPPVDYIAPGSSIHSTYKGGGYKTLSGTSMAAPHVCGILLLGNIVNGGEVERNSNDKYIVAKH